MMSAQRKRTAAVTSYVLGVAILCGAPRSSQAQNVQDPPVLEVDLAVAKDSSSEPVEPGRYQVGVHSLVPTFRYSLRAVVLMPTIKPIKSDDLSLIAIIAARANCLALDDATSTLRAVVTEEHVPAAVERVVAEKRECRNRTDPAKAQALLDSTKATYGGTPPRVFVLRAGEILKLTITRTDKDGDLLRKWVVVYTTPPAGEWRTTYGFAFPVVSGLNKVFKDQASYYAKDIKNDSFQVTRDRTPRRFDAVPAVMFSYLPAHAGGFWPGLTGGIGPDLTKLAVLLGLGWTYRSNLHLSVGGLMRQEQRLAGRYKEGDTITTNLTAEQLHENDWRLRPYAAVTFRFDKNIFGGAKPPPEAEEEPKKK